MKILHISKYYYPYLGGVENICKYLAEGTSFADEVAILCFNDDKCDKEDNVGGLKVYRVASKFSIAKQAFSLSYFSVMKKALEEFAPDIIHFHWANPYPALVLLTMIPKNVKLVVHWHMDIIKQKKLYWLVKPIERRLLKRADVVVVTSPQYKESSKPLQDYLNKVVVVPNAMDAECFKLKIGDSEKIEAIKSRYNDKKIVFFVGRHIQYKGLEYLIDSEKYVNSDCVFLVAGTGPLTNHLKEKCKSNRVFFLGRLSDEELKLYHYAACIFAFPSITKNEAFGVALAEAMYCKTPCVTFTIEGSGVNWVSLNGVTGVEVPNRDSVAFAKAIDLLLQDSKLHTSYSENAYNRVVENFTVDIMNKVMDEAYEKLFV
jgi:glycosyltransferase involved in cell wall biosynthesis